jgi:5-hydroxyisourate hydrolase
MSSITTHILDLTTGTPAAGVAVTLERQDDDSGWRVMGQSLTNSDGRVNDLIRDGQEFVSGSYRLVFDIGPFFQLRNVGSFFPEVTIGFAVIDPQQHYHVPLLLSPFGYSTYRGS